MVNITGSTGIKYMVVPPNLYVGDVMSLNTEVDMFRREAEELRTENAKLRAAAVAAVEGYAKGDDIFGPMQVLRAACDEINT